jgi:putative acetyltransferase
MPNYPDAVDPSKVGDYPALAGAGGGYVWDEVLEYRVWCHPKAGGDDFFYAYSSYDEARLSADSLRSTDESLAEVESPLALILQRERIDEPETGVYVHVVEERLAEWPPEFLSRPKRTPHTIPDFLAPDAPPNRLDIIRGLATKKT